MSIGSTDEADEIVDMISVDSRLHTVMGDAIYAIQLADDVDPARSNESIRNNQQCVLNIGANDPIVAKLFLTAQVLFTRTQLGEDFDEERAVSLAWRLTKQVAAMDKIRSEFDALQAKSIADFEGSEQSRGSLQLPSVGSVDSQFDAFSQKLGHAVDTLKEISRLFIKDLPKKWIDNLVQRTNEQYGPKHSFSQFAAEVAPYLLFMREMRNMIEHPRPERRVEIFDFRQLPSGEIMPPSVEIVAPDEDGSPNGAVLLMRRLIDDLTVIAEALFAQLCGATMQTFSSVDTAVMALPEDQRSHINVRMSYVMRINGEWVRFG